MDSQEYKDKKLDKLMRDSVKMVNAVGSFGYGDVVDAVVKNLLTSNLISIIRLNEIANVDIEILSQSVTDEFAELSGELVTKIKLYDKLVHGSE